MTEVTNDIDIFQKKQSVVDISKLLVRYHENYDEFELVNSHYYYPCFGSTFLDSSSHCVYYIIRKRRIITTTLMCLSCALLKKSKDRQLHNSTKLTARLKPMLHSPIIKETLTEQRTKSRKAM